jgi:hypothetical protein
VVSALHCRSSTRIILLARENLEQRGARGRQGCQLADNNSISAHLNLDLGKGEEEETDRVANLGTLEIKIILLAPDNLRQVAKTVLPTSKRGNSSIFSKLQFTVEYSS